MKGKGIMNNITPEKYDVDISKLFNWSNFFDIVGLKGEDLGRAYIRVIGDADTNRAVVVSRRKSAEFRKKLKDLESDERIAYIPEIDEIEVGKLEQFLIYIATKTLYLSAIKELNFPFPKEPDSDAPLEKMEKYQEEVDSYQQRFTKAVEDSISSQLERETNRIKALSPEEKYKQYVDITISELCEGLMSNTYTEYCAYAGSYQDPDFDVKYFKTFEEFVNLPYKVKEQFLSQYKALEMDLFDLKK